MYLYKSWYECCLTGSPRLTTLFGGSTANATERLKRLIRGLECA